MISGSQFLPQAISISANSPILTATYSVRFLVVFVSILCTLVLSVRTEAQLASQFSLSIGEEYNDNIFFSKQKEHDFITQITPNFSITYQPPVARASTLTLNIAPTAQIFARHTERNNFGRNLTISGDYSYPFSPRLTFTVAESLRLQGVTRTVGVGANSGNPLPSTPTAPPSPTLTTAQNLGNFISNRNTLSNNFAIQGNYLFAPNINFSGGYSNGYTRFIDTGGSDISNSINVRGIYKWQEDHNLHAGYRVGLIRSRNGGNNVIHDFDIGDDYFSSRQIQLTPTLTLSGSTGISVNSGGSGPRLANNSTVTLIKIWEQASFTAGARKGLTGSFGVSGVSDTLTLFSSFNMRVSERLSALATIDHSRFDTDDTDFNTLQASLDLQYALTSWLCPSLRYSHRRRASDSGARNANLQIGQNVHGNSVFLTLSANFEVWPNQSLSRQGCGGGLPTRAVQNLQSPRQ